ncbi:integrin alpha-E-like [Polymixia lowei]
MVWTHILLLMVIWTAAGFNIYHKPIKTHFPVSDDALFGQTMVQSKDGVLVPSPNSKTLFSCDLNKCIEKDIPASAKGLKPIVSVANLFTDDSEKSMICQQVRKKQNMNEDFNGECAFRSNSGSEMINPATLAVNQIQRNNGNGNNNNNNGDEGEEETDDTGTEIAFVLDGSGSISPLDFEIAKKFISTVMTKVWQKCFNCDFAVVQYGSKIRSELLLKESIENGTRAVEKVKNIKQIYNATVTASAIQFMINHTFVPENGSNPDAKKIMIVLSDGAISNWDKQSYLNTSLRMLAERNIIRFAIGVGEVKREEMLSIAGNEENLMLVDDYEALNLILSQLETSIIGGIEGLNQGDGFKFQLSEAGFSSHLAPDGSLLFGAVGANDWSGGVILKSSKDSAVSFLQGDSLEPRFSYLGYSVLSAKGPSEVFYISGAPRYNLTGGVFVFEADSHKQRQIIQGDQVGSYFGSVLCALDVDKNGMTDYLLIGASSFYQSGEEGRVYVYKLKQGMFHKEDFELQGLERYVFARFGSAIADVGDLDGNKFNDVAIGAPLEEDELTGSSGSIYIYNGLQQGLQRQYSQRISPADFGMKLNHFGQSVSAFSYKKNSRQPYISVGSKGRVTVLETLPVITFNPSLKLTPKNIPLLQQKNKNSVPVTLKICFNTYKGNIAGSEELQIPYNIDLDAGQNAKRLDFDNKADKEGTLILRSDEDCLDTIHLKFVGCYDCFSPIMVRMKFSLPSPVDSKPLRILDAFTPNVYTEEIQFDKDCAGECFEKISLSDSRLHHSNVVIGSTKSNAIAFNLTNSGDGAYMTMLILTYPNVLQYSQLTPALEGSACENEMKETFTVLKCRLLYPVFRRGAQANFTIHWQLVDKKSEILVAEIKANLTCENQATRVLDSNTYSFGIKNALKIQLEGEANPHLMKITDTIEKTPITFKFKLLGENKYNASLTVTIRITKPAHHADMDITHVEPKDKCSKPVNTKVPTQGEYVIQCKVTDLQDIIIKGDAEVSDVQSSEAITASAGVEYETGHYQLVGMTMTSAKVEVTIFKQEVVKSMPAIIGGSIVGFLVLAILIGILIKCGFFNRRNQQSISPN